MTHLKSLRFVEKHRATAHRLSALHPRERLLAKLADQRAALEAQIRGETFSVIKRAYSADADGAKTLVTKPVPVKPWWFREGNTFFVQLRYGNTPLPLDPKKLNATSIEAGATLDDVTAVIDIVTEATRSGELDAILEKRHSALVQRRKVNMA